MGSDTLGVLMRTWADKFKTLYPDVKIDIESKGSATAPPALTEGAAQVGPMSRPMSEEEIERVPEKVRLLPRLDAGRGRRDRVFVNKDNPIQCLTIPQLDQIFSKTHLYSGGINVDKWGAVGLTGEWASKPIALFGRNAQSGTHEIFVNDVLAHGDFKDNLKEEAGSEGVVAAVAADKYAIGYSGIGYLTDGVRAVPLAATAASKCADAWFEVGARGQISARALPLYLSEQGPEEAAGARGAGVRQIHPFQGRPGRDDQGRRLSPRQRDADGGNEAYWEWRRRSEVSRSGAPPSFSKLAPSFSKFFAWNLQAFPKISLAVLRDFKGL